jgi:hypothetical protein
VAGDFLLSPGITPFLTDLFVVGIPVGLALAYAANGARGFEIAFGIASILLGAVKLVTDFFDPADLLVALGGLSLGAFVVAAARGRRELARAPEWFWRAGGVFAIAVGAFKISRDFYDPFDLLLADCLVGLGAWVLLAGSDFSALRRGGVIVPGPGGSERDPPV